MIAILLNSQKYKLQLEQANHWPIVHNKNNYYYNRTLTLCPSNSFCFLLNLVSGITVGGIKNIISNMMSTPTIANKYISLISYKNRDS